MSEAQIKQLRQAARQFLPNRLSELSRQYGLPYGRLQLRHQRSRWGSCSSQNNISLNIALMNLRPELRDYVILHELMHTRHKNHAAAFWDDLSKICPRTKELRREMRHHNPHVVSDEAGQGTPLG